jgi:hypothetical protein
MSDAHLSGAWHADTESLRGWVDGTSGPIVSVSVEQHVLACARCRAEVAELVPATSLTTVWDAVLAEVEVPRASRIERALKRVGLSQSDTMVLSTAPVLRTAWVAALIAILSFSLLAALEGGDGALVVFLAIAPLIPVGGVALAYGPAADPSYEAVLVTPYPMIRLVLLRTAAVLTTSMPITVGVGLVLPISTVAALAWLLPAAGFTAGVLTASAWVEPEFGAIAIALSWLVAVGWATRMGDPLAVLDPLAMVGYGALLCAGAAILALRAVAATPSWRLL